MTGEAASDPRVLIEIDEALSEWDRLKEAFPGDPAIEDGPPLVDTAGMHPGTENLLMDFAHVTWADQVGYPRKDGKPRAYDYLRAARVPETIQAQEFGLWTLRRVPVRKIADVINVGFNSMTILQHLTEATMHEFGEVVMEDSRTELRRHLPIWFAARGRVLVTGLGLGCVVRGLLIKPEVEHIDVVEIDRDIIKIIGATFADEKRVTIHQGDALTFKWAYGTRWDYGWHDLWVPKSPEAGADALQVLHAELFMRHFDDCSKQGAWGFPRELARAARRRHPDHFI